MNNIKYNSYLITIIVALGGFLMGFDASVISGVIRFIEPQFALSKLQLGWVVGCLTLTATLGMLMAGPLTDRFGRKKILFYAAILFFISAVYAALAPDYINLIIARMIGGFGVGFSLIIAPMYIAEIAPPESRGKLVSFNQLNIVLGISVSFFSNYAILKLGQSDTFINQLLKFDEYNWRWMLGLEALPAIVYFFLLFRVPESPRWKLMKGEEEEAIRILAKVNPQNRVMEIINEVKINLRENEQNEKAKIRDLFKPSLKLILLIGITLAILQQITGINAVFFYAPMIFEQTGIGADASFSQAILVGLINIVFTIIAMGLIDRIGRKPLLIIGLSGIIISLFLLTFSFSKATYTLTEEKAELISSEIDKKAIRDIVGNVYTSDLEFKQALKERLSEDQIIKYQSEIIANSIKMKSIYVLLGILGFVASFAISLGPVMWVLFSELFPNRLRGIAISFAGFINSTVSFTVQLVFPWELANIGNSMTFAIYGGFALIGLILIFAIVPETKGKTLEFIEKQLVK